KEGASRTRITVVYDVEIEGLKVQAQRDKKGMIDILQPVGPPPAPTPKIVVTETPHAEPAGPAFKFLLERLALSKGTATFVDDAVSPRTTLVLGDLSFMLESLAWPVVGPASLAAGANLPGGGRLDIKGSLIPQPVDVIWTMTVRDAPTSATLAKAGFRRPQAQIERDKDGHFDIVKLFGGPAAPTGDTAPAAAAPPPAAAPPGAKPPAAKPKGLLETMSLRFDEVRI